MSIPRRLIPLLLAAAGAAAGCQSKPAGEPTPTAQSVYVDTRTGKVVRAEHSVTLPAVHPGTGKRTLMPGLYCAECRKWYPAPPLEVRHRAPAAGKCPRHGTALTPDGPLPGE